MEEKISYEKFMDYLLFTLKECKDVMPESYLSLIAIAKIFDYNASFRDIQEIAKYLETMGYIKTVQVIGDIRAQINPQGQLFIEKKSNEFKEEYKNLLSLITGKKGEVSLKVFKENSDPKTEVKSLLDQLSKKIIDKQGYENDFNKDIEIIKLELSKSLPDIQLIELKLNKIQYLDYIVSEVQVLKSYFNIDN